MLLSVLGQSCGGLAILGRGVPGLPKLTCLLQALLWSGLPAGRCLAIRVIIEAEADD